MQNPRTTGLMETETLRKDHSGCNLGSAIMMSRPSFRESYLLTSRVGNRVRCSEKSSGERVFPESGEVWEFLRRWFDIPDRRGILRVVLGKVASIGAAIADVPDSVVPG